MTYRIPLSFLLVLSSTVVLAEPICPTGGANIVNMGAGAYVIGGLSNPALTVIRGCTYTFNITASGHPFLIKTIQGSGAANQYTDGVTGNGTTVGTLTWTVAQAAPSGLFYNCQIHGSMTGTITVLDNPTVFVDDFET
jgi:hypothetical protein